MYLTSFSLPIDIEMDLIRRQSVLNGGPYGIIDNPHPCGVFSGFSGRYLYKVDFGRITIFYGGNGSGKSTLLNLIAEKLKLNRVSPYSKGDLFDLYVNNCEYTLGYDDEGFPYGIPNRSRIITSDDVFDYMLSTRTNNEDIRENQDAARSEWAHLKFGDTIKFKGMEDYDALRMQVLARRKSVSRRQFVRRTAGTETILNSNGEIAIRYFESKLKNDTLYCLDEPENSLSPKLQLELVELLEEMAWYCGCQFIIATHSPFLLALKDAIIYNLDSYPVKTNEWWELENTKTYYEFFKKYGQLFEK